MVLELRWILLVLGLAVLVGIYFWGQHVARRGRGRGRGRGGARRMRAEPHLSLEDDLLVEPGTLARGPELARAAPPAEPRWADLAPAGLTPQVELAPEVEPPSSGEEPLPVPVSEDAEPASVPRGWLSGWRRRANHAKAVTGGPDAESGQAAEGDPDTGEAADEAAPPVLTASVAPDKIVALRVVPRHHDLHGDRAVRALRDAGLEHGHYRIFHRPDPAGAQAMPLFSVANLTEPGIFDLEHLGAISGLSFFMALPGTNDPVLAFDMMVETARALARTLDADLFDDRGSSWSIQRERYVREELISYRHQHARGPQDA